MWKTLLRGALALALLSTPVLGQQVWKWSQTPATNATSDPAINWATGMAPSAVSPSARAMMAGIAKYRDDVAGRLTTSGTSTAYTVTTNTGYASTPADGTKLTIVPHATNGASATLAADSGTAFPIRVDASNAVPAAALVLGSPYSVVFNSSASAWILHGYYGSPSQVPIGAVLDYAGTSAPNSNFALTYGQAISRTTYAGLFSQVGTTFGVGDGTTTFNLPDTRGRAVYGLGNMGGSDAGRITVAGGNFDGTTLGNAGGAQNHTLSIGELPIHTPSGTILPFTPTGSISSFTPAGSISSFTPTGTVSVANGTNVINAASVGSGANITGGGGAYNIATVSASFTGNNITPTFTGNLLSPSFTGNLLAPNFVGNSIGSGNLIATMPPAIILSKIIRIF